MGEIDRDDEKKIEMDPGDETENISDTFTLKFYKKRNRTPAFVTEFANGQVRSDGINVLHFESSKSTANTRCLSANNGRLNYTGLSTNSNQVPLQYFVGVRDKRTGKMKLYDSCFFRMKPIVNADKTKSESVVTTPKSYRENINELTAHFGSKTKKRAVSSNLRNAVSDSPLDDDMRIQDIASVSSTPEVTPIPTENMTYLPPLNRQAELICDVFDVRSIISPQEDEALEVEARSLSGDELANKMSSFNRFVRTRFEKENLDITKTKYLIYYNYLVQFQQLGYQDIRKHDPAPHIPNPYKSKFLSNYTVESVMASGRITRSIPTSIKDKLVAYILVLALIIDDFTIDISDVANDLKSHGLNKLATITQVLGCHVCTRPGKEGVKTKFAVLKLPLYVMTLKHGKKASSK